MLVQGDAKRQVVEFYEKVVNARDYQGALPYLGPYYIQHNPEATDGADGLRAFIEMMKAQYPQSHCDVKRVFVDGDYVILQVHVMRTPDDRGSAHVDIFRLENGKVVEHWDVDQPIPEKTLSGHGLL
jgi:predicted SnoaL-like aldol condensation-catalyzing enzyme